MIAALQLFAVCGVVAQGPVLGIEGTQFTLDGKAAFLLGISYYGALAIEDEAIIAGDLDEMKACGFNWVRVWTTWNAFDNNVSAVAGDGTPREPYMSRLERLCRLAGERGMVVDVTVTRGDTPGLPSSMDEHRMMVLTLARRLKPFRNVYFDLGNERNIGDARHVTIEEIEQLVQRVRDIDPDRLCTASQGGDISDEDLVEYVTVGKVNFIAPHRGRHEGVAQETAERTQRYLEKLRSIVPMPVHFQEPFRRGYDSWEPALDDFVTDLEHARSAGAAGWCFHNGSVRKRGGDPDQRPRRSFDLRKDEGRLFDQFDDVEKAFLQYLRESREKP